MAASRTQALTDGYLGSDLEITRGSVLLEIDILDGSEVSVAGVIRVTAQNGTPTSWPKAAGETYLLQMERDRQPGFITFNIRSLTGTPTAQILEV